MSKQAQIAATRLVPESEIPSLPEPLQQSTFHHVWRSVHGSGRIAADARDPPQSSGARSRSGTASAGQPGTAGPQLQPHQEDTPESVQQFPSAAVARPQPQSYPQTEQAGVRRSRCHTKDRPTFQPADNYRRPDLSLVQPERSSGVPLGQSVALQLHH